MRITPHIRYHLYAFFAAIFMIYQVFFVYLPALKPDPTAPICKHEDKVLNEKELLDHFLFREEDVKKSNVEKERILEYPGVKYPLKYPECCNLGNISKRWYQPNKNSPGIYVLYEYYRDSYGEYQRGINYIDLCGELTWEMTGSNSTHEEISKEDFEKALIDNRLYWQKRGFLN